MFLVLQQPIGNPSEKQLHTCIHTRSFHIKNIKDQQVCLGASWDYPFFDRLMSSYFQDHISTLLTSLPHVTKFFTCSLQEQKALDSIPHVVHFSVLFFF